MKSSIVKSIAAASLCWLLVAVAGAQSAPATEAERNKATAIAFWNTINTKGWDAGSQYLSPRFREYSGASPSGAEELKKYYNNLNTSQPKHYSMIKRAFAEGDMVFLHVHSVSAPGQFGTALMCFFRFEDGKILEQWTAKQDVVGIRNFNGMF